MQDPQNLGEALKRTRKSFGYSQEEFGELVGKSRPAYTRIESGQTKISPETYYAMTELFYARLNREKGVFKDEGFSLDEAIDNGLKAIKNLFKGGMK